jgi:hypothetical protein
MNLKNIDFTGMAILAAGAVVLFLGYKAYKKTSDAAGAFGEKASEVVKNIVEAPGKAVDAVAASLGFTNVANTKTPTVDLIIDKKKPPTDKDIFANIYTNEPGSYTGTSMPTETDVLMFMADEDRKRRMGNTDYKPPSIVYDGVGFINDAATLNGNF